MKTILAMVMIASVWYTANLRAQNQVPGDQVDKNETATAPASPGSAPSPEAPAASADPRRLTSEDHEQLIVALSEASGNRVWFVTQANDEESDSFQLEIEEAFLQAGWEIVSSTKFPGTLRAGVRVFIADEAPPDHVSIALNGFGGIGMEVFAGTGYRDYYEKKKEENPNFSGIELAPDQDFVIAVGRNPPAE